MSLPDYMTRRIYTIADAHAFIRALNEDGLFFYLEAALRAWNAAGPVFTDGECAVILQRQGEIWALTDDPCQLAADALGDSVDDDEHDDDDDRCRPPFAYKPD